MNKELEAYDRVATYLALNTNIDSDIHKDCLVIQQVLTPPTAEEIIEEIQIFLYSKYFLINNKNDVKVRYYNGDFEYNIYNTKWQTVCGVRYNNDLFFGNRLPLTTMNKITTFFMGVDSNE